MKRELVVLGMGCAKCEKLAELTEKAAKELGLEYELRYVKDITEIMRYGVPLTPALIVDGKVKVSGKVPSYEAIKEMLSD